MYIYILLDVNWNHKICDVFSLYFFSVIFTESLSIILQKHNFNTSSVLTHYYKRYCDQHSYHKSSLSISACFLGSAEVILFLLFPFLLSDSPHPHVSSLNIKTCYSVAQTRPHSRYWLTLGEGRPSSSWGLGQLFPEVEFLARNVCMCLAQLLTCNVVGVPTLPDLDGSARLCGQLLMLGVIRLLVCKPLSEKRLFISIAGNHVFVDHLFFN